MKLTVSIKKENEQRVLDAFTEVLQLGRPAKLADVREYLGSQVARVVRAAERTIRDREAAADESLKDL